ncbi:FAD-dependent oxidoreductase [Flavihumibacter petaseus]|uniref:Putative oxidoreductase n=1 Tax=Flavihumibacter petaseus NBRC 106054 TaxID=1220578 RepID=A0A0E9MZB3_9BACT|nr:FAD-dependent oxidoreductase [Flavihumibacter petaseus]GAO43082.1 putative oxidoreductase [Flavihumibacter petaseus NBRC 106054]
MSTRDGANRSLWQQQPAFEPANKSSSDRAYEVIIVGGGITGISTALSLQRAGKKCLVLEAAQLGYGTTGGTTAHLNTLLDTPYSTIIKNFNEDTARHVASAASEAIAFIQQNMTSYHIDCGFEPADAWLMAQDKKQQEELQEIAVATRKAGLMMETGLTAPFNVPHIEAARISGQAKFHPLKYTFGLAAAFENLGGVIQLEERVLEVKEKSPLSVITNRNEYSTTDLIYATHIPPGVNWLHLRSSPWRSYAMAFTLADNNYPADLFYDMQDPYHYYRSQEVDGQTYLIAGGYDHPTGVELNTNNPVRELEAHARHLFPVDQVVAKWSSQYYEPADGLPYIGLLPGHGQHIYVATGFGGNGMTYSSVAALVLTDLILVNDHPYRKVFDPFRVKPIAGFKNFLQQNVGVVKELVKRLLPADKIPELVALAPGEAGIVNFEGDAVAMYKDESGEVHAVSHVCTHLKCGVQWNATELSWDCPCHGARYSVDGRVLNGPADKDLEAIPVAPGKSTSPNETT